GVRSSKACTGPLHWPNGIAHAAGMKSSLKAKQFRSKRQHTIWVCPRRTDQPSTTLFNVKLSFTRFALIAVWTVFLCKGLFYAVLTPIWEGYDEWAHFAYVQHVAVHHELPVPDTRISLELERSLELVPLSWELRDFLPPPHVTHDLFWKLPAD